MSAFSSSSQSKRWMFDSLEAFHQARIRIHSNSSSSSSQSVSNENPEELAARMLDEDYIIRHCCGKIQECVGPTDEGEERPIKRGWKVPATACTLFRRFYLYNSILDYDPRIIIPVCIFLASKVEESYIRVNEICEVLKVNVEDVQKFEMKVLEELKFDVRIFHPEGCLDSIIADYYAFMKIKGSEKNEQGDDHNYLFADAPSKLHQGSNALHFRIQRAKKNLKLLKTTPCSLIASPALIAMAILRQDTTEDGEQLSEFEKYVSSRLGVDALQTFQAKEHEINLLLEEVGTDIDVDRVKRINKKLSKASSWKKKKDKS